MKIRGVLFFLGIVIVFFLFAYFLYGLTGQVVLEREKANLTRAIDGDTADTSLGRVRLLGINNKGV